MQESESSKLLRDAPDDIYEPKTCKQKCKNLWLYRKKTVIITGIIILLILIAIIVVVALLASGSGSSQPDTPTPAPPEPGPPEPEPPGPGPPEPQPTPDPIPSLVTTSNPYQLGQPSLQKIGKQKYILKFVNGTNSKVYDFLQSTNNSYIEELIFQYYQISYDTFRLQFLDRNRTQPSFQVPDSYLSNDYLNYYKKGLTFNNTAFEVHSDSNGYFYYELKSTRTGELLVSTFNQSFVSMDHYQQIGLKVMASAVYGLGERIGDFKLQQGNQTVFSFGGTSQGQQPFMLAQLNNQEYLGIFFFNSNAQQYKISYLTQQVQAQNGSMIQQNITEILFTSVGGIIDIFFLQGPTYQDVVRQYHRLVGKPTLLELWNQGFFTSSNTYYDNDVINQTLNAYLEYNIPVEGIGIDERSLINNLNLSYKVNISQIQQDYDIHILQAFTSLVNIDETTANILNEIINENLIVKAAEEGVLVQELATDELGFCFDFFNPDLPPTLQAIFAGFPFDKRSLWLQDNAPFFETNNVTSDPNITDPYVTIPFWPGQNGNPNSYNDYDSLPFNSIHLVGRLEDNQPITEYHFNLHGLYGSKMTRVIKQYVATQKSLVVTDQTFAGLGREGIAHVLMQDHLNYLSLNNSVAGIMAFNLFGIPNVSPNICGFYITKTASTYEACLKSFQLAFISPFAMQYAEDNALYHNMINNYTNSTPVASLLLQRLKYMIYTRSELYKIQKKGGTLVRPLFADFPNYQTQFSYESVMYGDALLVRFNFEPSADTVEVNLPPCPWFDLVNMIQIKQYQAQQGPKTYVWKNETLLLFQKPGTIIATQDVLRYNVTRTKQLVNTPIQIYGFINNSNANIGHVLIEDEVSSIQNFYEIKANNNFMTIKPQSNITDTNQLNTNIEKITLAFTNNMGVNKACAILSDYQTIQPLFVNRSFYADSDQYNITIFTPNNMSDPTDMTTLPIQNVSFIVYGYNIDENFTCQSILQSYVVNISTIEDHKYSIQIAPNLKRLVRSMKDYILNITITANGNFFDLGQDLRPLDEDVDFYNETVYNQTETDLESTIWINTQPFILNVHLFEDLNSVLFTTQNQNLIVTPEFVLFGFVQPSQIVSRVFGLGEREGPFFLQDRTTYSLFTNANNLQDMTKQYGGKQVFGKNGFFPLIISNTISIDYWAGVNLMSGSKDVYISLIDMQTLNEQLTTQVIQAQDYLSFQYAINTDLFKLYGQLIPRQTNTTQIIIPPDHAYGTYASTQGITSNSELKETMQVYQLYKLPFEGFYLDYSSLDNFESLTYDENVFSTQGIEELSALGVSVITKSLAGINVHNMQAQQVLQQNLTLNNSFTNLPQQGQDQTGNVIYIDYTIKDPNQTNLTQAQVTQQIQNFESIQPNFPKYSIELVQNEPTNFYCNGDCYSDNQVNMLPNFLYKVGINDQLEHSFNYNKSCDNHNLYGSDQAVLYSQVNSTKKMVLSESTSYQSGQVGNVGRLVDYIDEMDSYVETLQAMVGLSMNGISNIGFKWTYNPSFSGSKSFGILSSLLPLTVNSFKLTDVEQVSNQVMYFKLMMLKYIKTQAFISAMNGTPLIRPMFMDFPGIGEYYIQQFTSFMYGSSFFVNLELLDVTPFGEWCEIVYLNSKPVCYDTLTERVKKQFLLAGGTITVLQDVFQGLYPETSNVITNTTALQKVKMDIHMIYTIQDGSEFAQGYLLIDNSQYNSPYCLIEITGVGRTMTFNTIVGKETQCEYSGYPVGRLIYLHPSGQDYVFAYVNGGTDPIVMQIDENRGFKYFDLSTKVTNFYELHTVTFE